MSEDRLNELRQRWEADPSSRVFLQLAEEYRRLGKVREAIEVLEGGLEQSPNHLSAHVALGRCRLELGENEKAVEILGRVLDRDPTQLVANKLLVQAHLNLGNLRRADLQLDRYSQLNSGDPTIEEMRAELEEARLKAAPPPVGAYDEEPAKKSASLLEDASPLESASPLEDPFPLEDPAPLEASSPLEDPSQLENIEAPEIVTQDSRPDPFDLSPAPPVSRSPLGVAAVPLDDPFPELSAGFGEGRRHLESLGSEGLFPVAPEPASSDSDQDVSTDSASRAAESDDLFALEEPAAPPAVAPDEEDLFGLEPPLAAHAAVETSFEHLDAKIHATPSPSDLPEPALEPVLEQAVKQSLGTGHARPETNFDRLEAKIHHPAPPELPAPPPAPPSAPLPAPGHHGRVETNFDQLNERFHHESPADAKPPLPEDLEEPATVTLGNLYREQGHEEKAKEVFRAVLDQDPTNAAALAALAAPGLEAEPVAQAETVAREETGTEDQTAAEPETVPPLTPLTAGDLLAGADPSLGLLDRKAHLLENYLRRIRREA